MKKGLIIVIFVFCLAMCSCYDEKWKFNRPYSDVKEISIIYLDNDIFSADEIINITPLKKIDIQYADDIYSDVGNLKKDDTITINYCYPFGYCILLNYDSQEYCLLSTEGSGYIYYSNKYDKFVFKYMKVNFKESDFKKIIDKYLNNFNTNN